MEASEEHSHAIDTEYQWKVRQAMKKIAIFSAVLCLIMLAANAALTVRVVAKARQAQEHVDGVQ